MCNDDCNMGDIYLIYNTISKKGYVGQVAHWVKNRNSRNGLMLKGWIKRVNDHFQYATNEGSKSKDHPKLYNAIRKYSRDDFITLSLGTYPMEELNDAEVRWISLLETVERGYNITHGGQDRRPYDVDALSKKITELWIDKDYRQMQLDNKKRPHGCPHNITPTFNKMKEVTGYKVQIIRKGIRYAPMFTKNKYPGESLEGLLDMAVESRDKLLSELDG
jgi:hypothetical protein